MKRIAVMILSSLLAVAATAQTPAPGTNTPKVDQREARQQARIAQGAASGSLTARETQRLEKEQAGIDKMEAKAKSDGTVTKQERRRLHAAQDAASHDIHRLKHNQRKASAPGQ